MANKYILIPHDLYRGLTETEPDNINLDFEKKQLNKTKRLKSAKNIQYNQELNRYLKIRKEHINKPVKVELTNGALLLAKNNANVAQPNPAPSSSTTPPSIRRTSSSGSTTTMASSLHQDDPPTDGLVFGTNQNVYDDDDDDGSLVSFKTPSTSTKKDVYALTDNPYFEPLYNMVTSDPQRFKTTRLGKIINNKNQPIPSSNIHEALNRILSPKIGESTPKGTHILRAALKKNPQANSLLQEGLEHSWKKKFDPSTPKVQQLNEKFQSTSTPSRTQLIQQFKPELWY
jgi:hypothetical protein